MKTRKTTQELFNLFTETVLKEHSKNKKLYDECVKIYQTTQLFDFTNAMTYDTTYKAISTNTNNMLNFIILDFNANIPTDSIYIKITEKSSMFLRDYDINIITGAFILDLDYGVLKLPFTIHNNDNECKIVFFKNKYTDIIVNNFENQQNDINNILNDIVESLQILQKMHNQIILIDEVEKPKTKYYRLKLNKETIKISQKPIYIVLDEPKHKKNYKHKDIVTQGHKLTRCFSFPVIGHWRKLKDITHVGKDKHGNYNIQGYTWVTSFVKGNKDMPLIRKENIIL